MTSVQETHIPPDDEVKTPKRGSWRVASGAICKGRELDGTYTTRPRITGLLKRCGIFFGKRDDGDAYGQVEVDLETATGPERVKVDLTDMEGKEKGSSASLSFLWGLLQCAKDELIVIEATQAKTVNKFGKFATYANFYTIKPGSTTGVPVAKRPRDDSQDLDGAVMKLREELKAHPAYADRPVHETDDADGSANTHLSALCKLAAEHGWPTPEQAPADWLQFHSDLLVKGEVKASLAQVDDHDWGQMILTLTERGNGGNWSVPKGLRDAAARLAAPVTANTAALD